MYSASESSTPSVQKLDRSEGQLASSTAIGVTTTSGFLGGVLAPLIGTPLAGVHPLMAFAGCFLLSALLFTAARGTGPRSRE